MLKKKKIINIIFFILCNIFISNSYSEFNCKIREKNSFSYASDELLKRKNILFSSYAKLYDLFLNEDNQEKILSFNKMTKSNIKIKKYLCNDLNYSISLMFSSCKMVRILKFSTVGESEISENCKMKFINERIKFINDIIEKNNQEIILTISKY